jgi:hypothetical protein
MSDGDAIERLGAICEEVGFDLDSAKPLLVERMRLLAEHTENVADSQRMVSMARACFRYHETNKPSDTFSDAERRIVVLGCLFADIGKTGPAAADTSAQRLIAEMFGIEGVLDETQPVTDFLSARFPADAGERTRRFASLGLDPGMSLREFWNLHSGWTLELLEASGVPPEVIAAAATHHLLEGVNPDSIVAADLSFTRSFGDNAAFDRPEKLIILLDKYDALLRRARMPHDRAIAWLEDRVRNKVGFRDDAEFLSLIGDLDGALRP